MGHRPLPEYRRFAGHQFWLRRHSGVPVGFLSQQHSQSGESRTRCHRATDDYTDEIGQHVLARDPASAFGLVQVSNQALPAGSAPSRHHIAEEARCSGQSFPGLVPVGAREGFAVVSPRMPVREDFGGAEVRSAGGTLGAARQHFLRNCRIAQREHLFLRLNLMNTEPENIANNLKAGSQRCRHTQRLEGCRYVHLGYCDPRRAIRARTTPCPKRRDDRRPHAETREIEHVRMTPRLTIRSTETIGRGLIDSQERELLYSLPPFTGLSWVSNRTVGVQQLPSIKTEMSAHTTGPTSTSPSYR